IHLKELIIGNLQCTFMNFKIFAKQIPNLQILTISTRKNRDMFEANLWEHLIRISLPHLITFNFNFGYIYDCIDDCIYGCIYGCIYKRYLYKYMFDEFQTNFWQEQYNCFTEYINDKQSIFIYTIPYISNTFELTPNTTRYYNTMINKTNESDDEIIIKKRKQSSNDQQFNEKGYQYINNEYKQMVSLLDIQNLTLHLDILTKECSYYFANV
ncbi:unnamed protein product, partial [Adineta steineri]